MTFLTLGFESFGGITGLNVSAAPATRSEQAESPAMAESAPGVCRIDCNYSGTPTSRGISVQEFPQNLIAPAINPFALSAFQYVRSGITAVRLTRRKARLRTEILGGCSRSHQGPSGWCLCNINNIRYTLLVWVRWNGVLRSPTVVPPCVEAAWRKKKWVNSWN